MNEVNKVDELDEVTEKIVGEYPELFTGLP